MNSPLPPLHPLEPWCIRYREGDEQRALRAATPEEAIAAACRLLYENKAVEAIGCNAADSLIGPQTLARFYRRWRQRRGLAAEADPASPPAAEKP